VGKEERDGKKNVAKGLNPDGTKPGEEPKEPKTTQRAQPMSKTRAKKASTKNIKSNGSKSQSDNIVKTNESVKEGDIIIVDGKKRRVKSVKKV
jgi:PleD family two-component response regulator